MSISWGDFKKVHMRIGRILDVRLFPDARTPPYKLKIDFGELGIRDSSAHITNYGQEVTGQSPVVDYSILPHLVSGTCISMVSYMCHGSISCRNSKRSGDDRSSR